MTKLDATSDWRTMARSYIPPIADDMRQWREDIAEFDNQMAAIRAQRELRERWLATAAAFIEAIGEGEPDVAPGAEQEASTQPLEEDRAAPEDHDEPPIGLTEDMTWVDAVYAGVCAYRLGVANHALKERMSRSPLGARLAASEKGYYHAVSRLAKRNKIVQHNGKLFSPDAFETYMQAVKRGELEDTPAPPGPTYSPMGDAIEKIIAAKPGIVSTDVIRELRNDPEFAATLHPKPTVAYNIIARLRKRHQIEKRDDGLYPAAQRNEPPRVSRGGSFAGKEDQSLPVESRPPFRLVG